MNENSVRIIVFPLFKQTMHSEKVFRVNPTKI